MWGQSFATRDGSARPGAGECRGGKAGREVRLRCSDAVLALQVVRESRGAAGAQEPPCFKDTADHCLLPVRCMRTMPHNDTDVVHRVESISASACRGGWTRSSSAKLSAG